jgi:hypothetical protein
MNNYASQIVELGFVDTGRGILQSLVVGQLKSNSRRKMRAADESYSPDPK